MQTQSQVLESLTKFGAKTPVKEVVAVVSPIGIKNVGNSCFVNSVLQCLASCSAFCTALQLPSPCCTRALHDGVKDDETTVANPCCLVCTFRKCILTLHDHTSNPNDINNFVVQLIAQVGLISRNISGSAEQHEDAQEFM